jgi:hypothetical protein
MPIREIANEVERKVARGAFGTAVIEGNTSGAPISRVDIPLGTDNTEVDGGPITSIRRELTDQS